MTALRGVSPRKVWLAGSSSEYASVSTITPPTPSTSSVQPSNAGAASVAGSPTTSARSPVRA